MAKAHFAVLTVWTEISGATMTVEVTTDVACHLWCRYTLIKPQIHQIKEQSGGYSGATKSYFCFVGYQTVEQNEAGDTLTHTFTITVPAGQQAWYFTFYGTVAGEPAASSTAAISSTATLKPGFPYVGSGFPYAFPLVLANDTIYASMLSLSAGTGGVWVSSNYGSSWSRLSPAGQPAGTKLIYAVGLPQQWVFVALRPKLASWEYAYYRAALFGSPWVELTANSFSPTPYLNYVSLHTKNITSSAFWVCAHKKVGSNYVFFWYSSNPAVLPAAHLQSTQEFFLTTLGLNTSATIALFPTIGSLPLDKTRLSNTSPFSSASWQTNLGIGTGQHPHVIGGWQSISGGTSFAYTTNSWVTRTSKNWPSQLQSAGGSSITSDLAIASLVSRTFLAVSQKLTGGIYRSTDLGTTWSLVHANTGSCTYPFGSTIGFFEAHPTWAWCLSPTGFWLSKDEGLTWKASSKNLGI